MSTKRRKFESRLGGSGSARVSLHQAEAATGLHQRGDQFRPFKHRPMDGTGGAAQRARFEVLGPNTLRLLNHHIAISLHHNGSLAWGMHGSNGGWNIEGANGLP